MYKGTYRMEVSGVNSKTLLDRQDSVYQDIEHCKTSYELRYAFAYEAAIRNTRIKELLQECILSQNDACDTLKMNYGFTFEAVLYYRITHKELFPLQPNDNAATGLANLGDMETIEHKYRLTPLYSDNESVILNDTAIQRKEETITKAHLEDYSDFQKLSFEPNFIRPKLLPAYAKRFYVELNMELPESELVEYIGHIHKIYHRCDVPGTTELLSDNIEYSSSKQTKANASKYADMLYVYDYVKKYADQFETDIEMHKKIADDLLYGLNDDTKKLHSTSTIWNYRQIMVDLVENEKFLVYLTGVETIV